MMKLKEILLEEEISIPGLLEQHGFVRTEFNSNGINTVSFKKEIPGKGDFNFQFTPGKIELWVTNPSMAIMNSLTLELIYSTDAGDKIYMADVEQGGWKYDGPTKKDQRNIHPEFPQTMTFTLDKDLDSPGSKQVKRYLDIILK